MDPKLLDILACPLCKSALQLNAEKTELFNQLLREIQEKPLKSKQA